VTATSSTATLRAAVYTRISNDPESTRLGVQRQEADCKELVDGRGWELVDVYEDDDISAYSGKVRPRYRQLLADVDAGLVDVIVAWHPDRLHRHPRELEEFIELIERKGATVETVRAGSIDLSTPTGRMVARMLGATARYESEHKADRIRRKHLELAATGKSAGGGRPFGYEADRRTVRQDEAQLVREAARRVLEGESMRSIARDWNDRGIPTVNGSAAWVAQVLRRLLVSARISGRREYAYAEGKRLDVGKITCDVAEWPAIITVDESDRLRALLAGEGRRVKRGRTREYLLTGGIARCGRCGAALQAHPRSNGKKEMACVSRPGAPGCGRLGVLAEPVEALIVEDILQQVDAGALARALSTTDDHSDVEELARVQEKLNELADMWRRDEISRGEWQTARTGLQERQAALEKRIQSQRRNRSLDGIPEALRTAWPSLPFHRQRAIVEVLIEQVIVEPATPGAQRFVADRIPAGNIRWKV
jgi:site-specific DNA recombinase